MIIADVDDSFDISDSAPNGLGIALVLLPTKKYIPIKRFDVASFEHL